MYSPWRRISPGRTFVSDTLRPHERLIADSCLANSSEGAKAIGQHGEGSYFVLATAPGMGNAQGRARGGAAAPDPQTQGAPLLHGQVRRVLPGPAGPRFRGGGPDGQAGDQRRRIQGGRREAPPVARGRPLQRRGRRLLDIRAPEHEDGPGMPAGLEGGLDGEDAPLPHSDMGRQHRVPAYRLALERTGIARPMSRKGSRLDNAKAENFFSMAKTELCHDWEGRPRCLREGSGEAYRPVWQRAHQETPGRKRPGRVQAQPGRLIRFFYRSGNGVLCSFGAQLNSIGPFAS